MSARLARGGYRRHRDRVGLEAIGLLAAILLPSGPSAAAAATEPVELRGQVISVAPDGALTLDLSGAPCLPKPPRSWVAAALEGRALEIELGFEAGGLWVPEERGLWVVSQVYPDSVVLRPTPETDVAVNTDYQALLRVEPSHCQSRSAYSEGREQATARAREFSEQTNGYAKVFLARAAALAYREVGDLEEAAAWLGRARTLQEFSQQDFARTLADVQALRGELAEAEAAYLDSARRGNDDALLQIAQMYFYWVADEVRATPWFRKAAAQGNEAARQWLRQRAISW